MPQKKVCVNFRVEEDLKTSFDAFCEESGFKIAGLMTLFMKTVVREQRIPFDIQVGKQSVDTAGEEKK